MAKLDRLLNLTAALIETTVPMTAEEIRSRVPGYSTESDDAFHRGFERDKDDLRELGVPIETVTVGHHEQPHAAYTIERDRYELDDPGFEPDELAAIHLAATAVQLEGLDPDDVDEGLRKLGGIVADAPDVGGSPIGAVPTPSSLLELFVAVLERRQVDFEYAGLERVVQPHRLQFERGRWYVTGQDLTRDARRSFRLDRIEGSISSGDADTFQPPEERSGVRLRPWELGEGTPVHARLLLDAEIARAVLNDDPTLDVVERSTDGSIVVELAVRNAAALRGFVLTLLDRAELLGPPELRADLLDWLRSFDPGTAAP